RGLSERSWTIATRHRDDAGPDARQLECAGCLPGRCTRKPGPPPVIKAGVLERESNLREHAAIRSRESQTRYTTETVCPCYFAPTRRRCRTCALASIDKTIGCRRCDGPNMLPRRPHLRAPQPAAPRRGPRGESSALRGSVGS